MGGLENPVVLVREVVCASRRGGEGREGEGWGAEVAGMVTDDPGCLLPKVVSGMESVKQTDSGLTNSEYFGFCWLVGE